MLETQAGNNTKHIPYGLSASEVQQRIAAGQVNDTGHKTSRSIGEIFRANVFTRFNAIIGVLALVIFVVGELPDVLFSLVIVANTVIGIVQEFRAKRTLDSLALVVQEPVSVMRDGQKVQLPVDQVVLGETILLYSGAKIPVDGEVVSSDELEIDESMLTGESDPVVKQQNDPVFSGSFVVAGTGAFTATKVGNEAYAAQLAEQASRFSLANSELRNSIDTFLKYIIWAITPVAILLIISRLSSDNWRNALLDIAAAIVTMIPEGLVLLTSMAFAVGVIRLGRQGCLVQELPAIEGLARVDVLCLDKTGTLTEPGLDLAELRVLNNSLPAKQALGALAANDPQPNPTMQAVAEAVPSDPGWIATHKVPFSSARKYSGAIFDKHDAWLIGAPDVVLAKGDPVRQDAEELALQGLRVVVLAQIPEQQLRKGVISSASPAALIVLRQRLRKQAPATLRYFEQQNVAIKVISGDNAASVGAVAAKLGVPGAKSAVDARQLPDDMQELAEVLEQHSVFGRVNPHQKRTFVAALKSRGHTVAMTGDGVNDVLALKDADLGVAIGSGSDASRTVAKVVLLQDSFAVLPQVVAEGRRVLGNIERVANLFLIKTMYALMLALMTGLLLIPLPFLPRHLTLIGALTIGIPAFFLALAPNNERVRPNLIPRVLRFAIPTGFIAAVATFSAYWLAHRNETSDLEADRSTAVLTLFCVSLVALALVARPYNWWRLLLVAAMAATFVIVVVIPLSREFFAISLNNAHDNVVGLLIAAVASMLLVAVSLSSWLKPQAQSKRFL